MPIFICYLHFAYNFSFYCWVVVDSQPSMEETILVGDDLMLGPPSPRIPPEIASHVVEGVDLCDRILRNLFLCKRLKLTDYLRVGYSS